VIERSLAHRPRTIRVDQALCEEIAELTDVEYWALSSAFLGFPPEDKDAALDVLEAAVLGGGGPEDWPRYVLAWAKENGRGMYHSAMLEAPELTYEYNNYLRSIGRI
jgi:hypothetical protein